MNDGNEQDDKHIPKHKQNLYFPGTALRDPPGSPPGHFKVQHDDQYLMLISVPINTVISMGEEFGWRAYLLQKLRIHFARSAAVDDDPASAYPEAPNSAGRFLRSGCVQGYIIDRNHTQHLACGGRAQHDQRHLSATRLSPGWSAHCVD